MASQTLHIDTSYGKLTVSSVGPEGKKTILCIHGNSSSNEIFKPIFDSDIPSKYRVLGLDLAGHGQSENANDPETGYTMPGYAKAAVELLQKLNITDVTVVGWSLGGHIAVEMLPLFSGINGIMIIGSLLCPIFKEPLNDERTKWNMREDLSEEELTDFARSGTGAYDPWMAKAAIRTDPRARRVLFTNLGVKDCSDQQKLARETKVPTAVVIGSAEPHLDNNIIKALPYGNLWSGKVVEITGGQHCPMWEYPNEFVPVLEKFLNDVAA